MPLSFLTLNTIGAMYYSRSYLRKGADDIRRVATLVIYAFAILASVYSLLYDNEWVLVGY